MLGALKDHWRVILLILATTIIYNVEGAGKSSRKQVEIEPLGGTYLRDVVSRVAKILRSIGNEELGATTFQEMLDKLEFTNISASLDIRIRALVSKLNSKLTSYVDLLKRSNEVIQPILLRKQNFAIYPGQSRRLDLLQNKLADICTQITNALATNLRDKDWKHLHILPVSQPGMMCGPTSLAHNIGPLLLSQCNKAKNVVLLIEHGAFMSEGDLTLAQLTAKSILDMLSETDYVTAIGVSGHGSIYCKEGLLRATDVNKFQLIRHIDSISRIETGEALSVDFKNLTNNVTGEIVVIHLTNTLKENDRLKSIVSAISSKKSVVHLRTVLILSDLHSHANLKDTFKNGSIITLPTQNVLGYEIARLFSGLKCSPEDHKDYYVSEPYYEPFSKAVTMSVGQITNTALLSLDIRLSNFIEDLTYFNAGTDVNAILFDKNQVVWVHKNFPRIDFMEQSFKVYLQNIENIDVHVVRKMIDQFEGFIEIKNMLGEKKQYRWKHLTYEDLIICLVSDKSDDSIPVVKSDLPLPSNILHHRLDLMTESSVDRDSLCLSQNRIITLATGVVYLSPWCFQSPMEQLKLLETESTVTVQSYMAFLKDLTTLLANPGLHPSVRPDVAILAQILDHYKQRHENSHLNKYIIRRYVVASVSGVMEVYPGMVLDSALDPKRRAWYGKALEHPGKITLTTPYLDAGGAGYVVTLSQTIYEGRAAALHSNSDPIVAVMSMDVTMGYITKLIIDNFPVCNEDTVKCFLMDDKGYLVSHPSLFNPLGKVEQQHLTHKEILVASDILNHDNFVKKKLCASHLDGTTHRYYQFNTSLDDVLTNIVHGEHCVKYQISAVPGSNVFLGVVNITCNEITAFCPCSTTNLLCLNCQRMEQTECECPCECAMYNSGCSEHNISGLEACPAPYEQGINLQSSWIQSASLKACPSFSCKSFDTEYKCLGVVGCQWCHVDSDAETPLNAPYCSDASMCFKGVFGSMIPNSDGSYNSQSTEEIITREWPSVGPVAGGILVFVLLLGMSLFCYRLRSVQSGLEHQCLHLHTAPDTLRMTPLDNETDPMEPVDQSKNNVGSLLRDGMAPLSPYRVSTNYRRPPGGDSDHGYSTMTPHDDSEQQTFVEPLLIVGGGNEQDFIQQKSNPPSPTTHLGSPHHVLAPVTVHRNMETNYC